MKKFLTSFVLGVGLLTPTAVVLAQAPRHVWADGENESWHRFLKERHWKDREWSGASKSQQRAYWRWRDKHPG